MRQLNETGFLEKINEVLNTLEKTQKPNIEKSGELIYNRLKEDGLLHIFCTGHSHMVAEEFFYRAGGLIQINPILEPFLMQHEGAKRSTKFERVSGIAKLIFESTDIREGEPLMVVSNSGINAVPIEMAMCGRANKNPVIAITSEKISKTLTSRHPGGKKLYEIADIVIDNCTPLGDGILNTDTELKVGSVSTIANTYIVQRLVINIVNRYIADGRQPPIYMSANVPGGDEYNSGIADKFQNRIRCLY